MNSAFYKLLEKELPISSLAQRRVWIEKINTENIDLKELSDLLFCQSKIMTRFLWMVSEMADLYPETIQSALPSLLFKAENIKGFHIGASFANLWIKAGVPKDQEAKAINLLFEWLQSPNTNVTCKSRSLLVLYKMSSKYPELKNELILVLENQKDKHSPEFAKRVNKILEKLNT